LEISVSDPSKLKTAISIPGLFPLENQGGMGAPLLTEKAHKVAKTEAELFLL